MSVTRPGDEMYGSVEVMVSGRKYREEYAAVKVPDYAEWMLDECPYIEDGTPLLPYPCVAGFKDWAEARNYEVRIKHGVWNRVDEF